MGEKAEEEAELEELESDHFLRAQVQETEGKCATWTEMVKTRVQSCTPVGCLCEENDFRKR